MSTQTLQETVAAKMARLRRPISVLESEVVVPKTYLVWGLVNLALSNISTVIPWLISFSPILRNAVVISGVLWIIVGAFRLNVPIRLCVPIFLVLLLQAWGAFSTWAISAQIGRIKEINAADFFIVRYLYLYFTASMLVYIQPKARRWILWMIFIHIGAASLLGYLQFVGFKPAVDLANSFYPGLNIENWDNRGGVRSTAFYGFPGHLAINAAMACMIITGALLVRRLTKWEIAAFVFFAAASVMPQARTHLPALALTVFVFTLAIMARERIRSSWFIIAGIVIASLFLTFGRDKLAYVFSTNWLDDQNMKYRRNRSWMQAELVAELYPWTGIGAEPRYWGRGDSMPDKFAPRTAFDNGWLLVRSSYGLVGVALVAGALLIGTLVPLSLRRNPYESDERKGYLLALPFMCIAVGVGMYGNNVVTWEPTMYILFTFAGLAMPTRDEEIRAAQLTIPGTTKLRPRNV